MTLLHSQLEHLYGLTLAAFFVLLPPAPAAEVPEWPAKLPSAEQIVERMRAADVILVNAGATRPAERWLDGLRDGGRLILPAR